RGTPAHDLGPATVKAFVRGQASEGPERSDVQAPGAPARRVTAPPSIIAAIRSVTDAPAAALAPGAGRAREGARDSAAAGGVRRTELPVRGAAAAGVDRGTWRARASRAAERRRARLAGAAIGVDRARATGADACGRGADERRSAGTATAVACRRVG